uniref:Uncharacterized protein n=1 Tax=Lepeophtheirus salmonis TaxID=72036 RepID=A0A0K2VEY0_LEPSM
MITHKIKPMPCFCINLYEMSLYKMFYTNYTYTNMFFTKLPINK